MAFSACKHILLQSTHKNQVVELVLNRPELHNAFNDEMIEEMVQTFKKSKELSHARLVVISGAGSSFCAGADLNWMKRMKEYSLEENEADAQNLAELFYCINEHPTPVIAVAQGLALGGGAGLLAVSDYVLAEESMKVGFTEARLGILPAVISPLVINKIGQSYARAYFTSGMKFSAQVAERMGLVHQLARGEDELMAAKEKLIQEFLLAAPNASKRAKLLVQNILELEGMEGKGKARNYTCRLIASTRIGEEAQEGMESLLQKRSPAWKKS